MSHSNLPNVDARVGSDLKVKPDGESPAHLPPSWNAPPFLPIAEPTPTNPYRPWVVALLGAVLVAVYFLSFPSHRYGYDAIEYAYGAKLGHSLFHPHHLLYNAAGRLLLLAVSPYIAVDAIGFLAAVNGVITALSVGLLCLFLHRVARSLPLAFGLSLLFAACRGITNMATSVEVYPATTLFELGALVLFVVRPRASLRSVIGMGLLSALASLFHQTGIFFVFAMAYGLWRRDRLLRHASVFLLTALGVCGGVYLWVGLVVENRPLLSLWKWITLYAHSNQYQLGLWGHGLRWESIPAAIQGCFQVITHPYYLENMDLQFRPSVSDSLFSLAVIGSLLLALRLSVTALRSQRQRRSLSTENGKGSDSSLAELRLRGLVWVWLFIHGSFTFWWEPGNFEFWLLLLPPVILLLGDLWRHLDRRAHSVWLQFGAMIVLLAVGNFGLCTIPNYRGLDNSNAEIYRIIARHGVDAEDVYIGDSPTLNLYFLYYQDKSVPLHSLRYLGYSDPAQKASVLTEYLNRIAEIRRSHRVFLLEQELTDQYELWTEGEVRAAYDPQLVDSKVIGTYQRGTRTYRIFRLAPTPATSPLPIPPATPAGIPKG